MALCSRAMPRRAVAAASAAAAALACLCGLAPDVAAARPSSATAPAVLQQAKARSALASRAAGDVLAQLKGLATTPPGVGRGPLDDPRQDDSLDGERDSETVEQWGDGSPDGQRELETVSTLIDTTGSSDGKRELETTTTSIERRARGLYDTSTTNEERVTDTSSSTSFGSTEVVLDVAELSTTGYVEPGTMDRLLAVRGTGTGKGRGGRSQTHVEVLTTTLITGTATLSSDSSTIGKPKPSFADDDRVFKVISSHPVCQSSEWLAKAPEKHNVVTQQGWFCFFQVLDRDRDRHVSVIEWSQALGLPTEESPGRIFALLASPGHSDEPLSFARRTLTLDKMALGFAMTDTNGNYELTEDEFRSYFGELSNAERAQGESKKSQKEILRPLGKITQAMPPHNDDRIFDIMAEEGTDCHGEGPCPDTIDIGEFNCYVEMMDVDRDHVVTHEEWTAFLKQPSDGTVGRIWMTIARQTPDNNFGSQVTKMALQPDDLALAFSYADVDGDYMVSRSEFFSYFGDYPSALDLKQGRLGDLVCLDALAKIVKPGSNVMLDPDKPGSTLASDPDLAKVLNSCYRVCKDTPNFCESVQRAGKAIRNAMQNVTVNTNVNDARMAAYCPGYPFWSCAVAHSGDAACGGLFEAMFGKGADKAVRGCEPWLPQMLSHCSAAGQQGATDVP